MRTEIDYNSSGYKRSRAAYIAQSTFDYFVALLVGDAFLAKLLTSLGVSDPLRALSLPLYLLFSFFRSFRSFL